MQRYWVMAPQRAKHWKKAWRYDLANNIISLGWNRLADISSLDKKQLRQLINRKYADDKPRSNKYKFDSLWDFYHGIKRGHTIIASQGRSKIAAIGTVTREAYYERNKNARAVPDAPYSNHLGVRWGQESRGMRVIPMLGRQAIYEISKEKFRALTRTELFGPGKLTTSAKAIYGSGTRLPQFDESELKAAMKARTIAYRHRHNKMTNALTRLWSRYKLTRGNNTDCLYDVLVENYNGSGRDLLVEVKPDPEKGALRIAVGQLYDYRRYYLIEPQPILLY